MLETKNICGYNSDFVNSATFGGQIGVSVVIDGRKHAAFFILTGGGRGEISLSDERGRAFPVVRLARPGKADKNVVNGPGPSRGRHVGGRATKCHPGRGIDG